MYYEPEKFSISGQSNFTTFVCKDGRVNHHFMTFTNFTPYLPMFPSVFKNGLQKTDFQVNYRSTTHN